jgi:hypothetical protein
VRAVEEVTMSQPTMSALARREASGRPDTGVLLFCGILSSLLYVAMNVYVPMQWEGYDIASQAVSELSAIDAPTRTLWVQLVIPYTILAIGFGCGVWMSAGGSRALRVVGGVFIADGVIAPFWPPLPCQCHGQNHEGQSGGREQGCTHRRPPRRELRGGAACGRCGHHVWVRRLMLAVLPIGWAS